MVALGIWRTRSCSWAVGLYPSSLSTARKGTEARARRDWCSHIPIFPGTSTVFTWNQNKTNYFWNCLDEEFSLQKHSSRNSLVILWVFNSILLYLYYLFLCYGRYSWHAIMTENCLNILFLFSFQNHYEQLLLSSERNTLSSLPDQSISCLYCN